MFDWYFLDRWFDFLFVFLRGTLELIAPVIAVFVLFSLARILRYIMRGKE